QLFAAYTDAMFRRRAKAVPYRREQTEHWLAWLARAMKAHDQNEFFLEWMQPEWLPGQRQQRLVTCITSVITGLGCGLLSGLGGGLRSGRLGGLIFGLIGGVLGGLSGGVKDPSMGMRVGRLIFGLGGGLIVVLSFWREAGLLGAVVLGLLGGGVSG